MKHNNFKGMNTRAIREARGVQVNSTLILFASSHLPCSIRFLSSLNLASVDAQPLSDTVISFSVQEKTVNPNIFCTFSSAGVLVQSTVGLADPGCGSMHSSLSHVPDKVRITAPVALFTLAFTCRGSADEKYEYGMNSIVQVCFVVWFVMVISPCWSIQSLPTIILWIMVGPFVKLFLVLVGGRGTNGHWCC